MFLAPGVMSALLLGQLLNVLSQVDQDMAVTRVGVMEVSALLFGPYVLAVELASILLLAGWCLPIISRSDSGIPAGKEKLLGNRARVSRSMETIPVEHGFVWRGFYSALA